MFTKLKAPNPSLLLILILLTCPSWAQVSLSAPSSAPAGSQLQVRCSGPVTAKDFLTIVPEGKGDSSRSYRYIEWLKKGNPVKIHTPDRPGRYEIRYVSKTGKRDRILGRHSLIATATPASVSAPDSVGLGKKVTVTWSGPNTGKEKITIVPEGSKEGLVSYRHFGWPKKGNPLQITAPSKPGRYEVRYLSRSENLTLAQKVLLVGEATASIEAPDRVKALESFEVSWTGPNNPRDWVIMESADENATSREFTMLASKGSPATFRAPNKNGQYFLRYAAGTFSNILAERPIQVGDAQVTPGFLRVVSSSTGTSAQKTDGQKKRAVEVILDCSGSMLKAHGSTTRMETARKAVLDLVKNKLPEGTPFALRAFGHTQQGSCETKLVVPFQGLKRSKALSVVKNLKAKNLAKTPIAASLNAVSRDLQAAEGARLVILLTDGEETCEGNPEHAIRTLRAEGFDVQVNIVGFAIDDAALKQSFRKWARLGGGVYFDAQEAHQIGEAFEASLTTLFEVRDGDNNVVGKGSVDGTPISLPPGQYTLNLLGKNPRTVNVVVEQDKETIVNQPR